VGKKERKGTWRRDRVGRSVDWETIAVVRLLEVQLEVHYLVYAKKLKKAIKKKRKKRK
jgi:hypothetical protein